MSAQAQIRNAYLARLDAHLATVQPEKALQDLRSERARVEAVMAWLARAACFDSDGEISLPGGLDFGSLGLIDGDLSIRINQRLDAMQGAE